MDFGTVITVLQLSAGGLIVFVILFVLKEYKYL